ncbi:sarcosine oxidase protein [Leptomonas pyrrhocoris]|uniref:Sarcosine oxidase protein n=1 Tax=Leptomonas pyrrhocoris TaxID=157538 RepID=A0A0N0VD68_LEPPY|nr:sarcosine oxidase protein [Leptomonas pyrrhocoris]KPA74678.1 sarcosine oxidase protein [Leptomonas pyrrhocoris]|eukprot:XP_015653117.1 sarcosine oxidase protein [Leptomonas pyrrhocoris]
MSATDYDVIVVGAGMFGSSAAKHLRRLQPSLRLAVIGPSDNGGPLARGQHFDEARICRRVETLVPWAHLNDLGALSYRETEATSGIAFYTPCGCVWVGTAHDRDASMACVEAVQHASGGASAVTYAVVHADGAAGDAAAAAAVRAGKTSVLRVTASSDVAEGVFGGSIRVGQLAGPAEAATFYVVESGPAGGGTVHPTRYVEAQLACAAAVSPADHYRHVREVVLQIACVEGSGGGDDVYEVKTDAARTYRAGRVLVATASFTKYHQLLPPRVTDRLQPKPADVVLLRLVPPHGDDGDHAANVRASELCPSIIRTTGPREDQFYCLPPRYYACYRGWYSKMGRVNGPPPPVLAHPDIVSTLEAAVAWYETGKELPKTDPSVTHLADMLQGLFPQWRIAADTPAQSNREAVRCIVDETKEEVPMVDCVDGKGLFCAIAGNGRGAKACDPIGCIAAHRLLGKELPPAYAAVKDLFRLDT